MAPWAPGLFSTSTGWPSAMERRCASCRALASAESPGGVPIINLIGRDGQAACANAPRSSSSGISGAAATARRRARREGRQKVLGDIIGKAPRGGSEFDVEQSHVLLAAVHVAFHRAA